MRVKMRDAEGNYKLGTIKYVYQKDGYKMFDILFDGEDRLNTEWSRIDKKRLMFDVEQFKMDFDKLLKKYL
jgi:hypothetical protein